MKVSKATFAVVVMVLMTGCGAQVPADPYGTLDRVRDGVVRVGVSENDPWVVVHDAGPPTGTESALITAFADQLGADVAWVDGSEAELVEALDRGDLDVVLAGFAEDTPWMEEAAATRPYAEIATMDGMQRHVMLVRLGENGFLTALERFLHEETGQ